MDFCKYRKYSCSFRRSSSARPSFFPFVKNSTICALTSNAPCFSFTFDSILCCISCIVFLNSSILAAYNPWLLVKSVKFLFFFSISACKAAFSLVLSSFKAWHFPSSFFISASKASCCALSFFCWFSRLFICEFWTSISRDIAVNSSSYPGTSFTGSLGGLATWRFSMNERWLPIYSAFSELLGANTSSKSYLYW